MGVAIRNPEDNHSLLSVSLRLLDAVNLEQRINGIELLTRFIPDSETESDKAMSMDMIGYLLQNNIVSRLLKQRSHIEILKRSTPIFSFLARHNYFQQKEDILALAWQSMEGQNDAYIEVLTNVLLDTAKVMRHEPLLALYKKLELALDTPTVTSVRRMGKFFMNSAGLKDQFIQTQGIARLSRFITKSETHNPEVVAAFRTVLSELLGNEHFAEFRSEVLSNLVLHLDRVDRQAAVLCRDLLLGLDARDCSTLIQTYEERYQPTFLQSVLSIVTAQAPNGSPQLLHVLFQILDETMSKVNAGFQIEAEFLLILQHLKPNSFSLENHEVFFNWITDCICTNKQVLNAQILESTFDFLIQEFKPETIPSFSNSVFQCFKQLFLITNERSGRLSLLNNRVEMRKHEILHGFDVLKCFALYGKLEGMQSEAPMLLAQLHTRIPISASKKTCSQFLIEISEALRTEPNPESRARFLRILESYILEYDSIVTSTDLPSVSSQYLAVTYSFSSNQDKTLLRLPPDSTFGTVRRVIASLHKFPAANTSLIYKEKIVTFIEDARLLSYETPPLHFQVVVSPSQYQLISFAQAIGRRYDLINDFMRLMDRETDQENLPRIWLILTHLVSNFTLQTKIKELGVLFEDLMEGSFHQQLFCLLVLESLQDDQEFKTNYEKRHSSSIVRTLLRDARGEGLIPFVTRAGIELSAQYAELMLYALFTLKASCEIDDGRLYTSCLLDLLCVLSIAIPEQYQSRPVSLSTCILAILDPILTKSPQELKGWVSEHPTFMTLLSNSLIDQRSFIFSNEMLEFFKRLIASPYDLGDKIRELCIGNAITAVQQPKCSPLYFSFTTHLILTDREHNYDTLYHSLFDEVRGLNPEPQSSSESIGFSGAFKLLEAILRVNPVFASYQETEYVLKTCLIDMQESSATHESRPKCKSDRSRSSAFSLFTFMLSITDENQALLTYLDGLHNDVTWRKPHIGAWVRDEVYGNKSETGFVGLRNMGNTCYLNAIVQQLYMIPNFRSALLQTELTEEKVVYQLQRLFIGLNLSDKNCLRPKRLCEVYLDFDGRPIDVRQQMDADEFLTGLLSKVEEELNGNVQSRLISGYFNGTFSISCNPSCSHGSTRTDTFPTLSIAIESHSSVLQGLQSLVATEMLTGENAYHCTVCDQKVSAERRCLIQVLPKVVFITLKRFRFDRDTQRKVKVNTRCEFPEEIDMAPFTVQGDRKVYKLRGVVIHYGAMDSGHYYSYIYDRTSSQWLRFEDALVTVSDVQQVKDDGFGTAPEVLESLNSDQLNSLRNAYMLLYETTEERKDISMRADYRQADNVHRLKQEREVLNTRYWKRRRVFSNEYRIFIASLIETQTDPNLFFAFRYLVTIGLRLRELPIHVIRSLYQKVENHPHVMNWVLEIMSYEPLFYELIVTCPKAIARKLVISLTVKCFNLAAAEKKQTFMENVLAVSHKLPRTSTIEYEGYYELLFRLTKANSDLQQNKYLLLAVVSPLLNLPNTCPPAALGEVNPGMCLGRINESMPANYPPGVQALCYAYHVALCNLFLPTMIDADLAYFKSNEVLTQFIKGAGGKFGASETANFAYSLIIRDADSIALFRQYISALALEVYESDNTALRTALVQVKAFIMKVNDDSNTQEVLEELLKSFEHNLMYVHATEETVLFLYSLCTRNTSVQQWVARHEEFMGALRNWKAIYTQWTHENPLSLALNKVFDPVAQYTQFIPRNQVLMGVNQLMDRRYPDLREVVDSDDALEEGAVTEGSEVEYYYMDFPYRKRVLDNFGTVLYLADTDHQDGFFVSVDADNLVRSRS